MVATDIALRFFLHLDNGYRILKSHENSDIGNRSDLRLAPGQSRTWSRSSFFLALTPSSVARAFWPALTAVLPVM